MKTGTLRREGVFYKGNLHLHTTVSDGEFTPEYAKEIYKNHGYDFIALTDHNKYGIHSELNDENFLVFPGVEVDTVYKESLHHIVGISTPEMADIESLYQFTENERGGVPPQTVINFLVKHHNLVIYAHPFWSYQTVDNIIGLKGLTGMEIYNHSCEQEWKAGNGEVFFENFLRLGHKLWCFASDDAHAHVPDYCGGYITVKTDELTHESIFNAIKEGSFYSSHGSFDHDAPKIYDFYVEDGFAHIKCSPCRTIYINSGRKLYEPTHMKDGIPVTEASLKLTDDIKFVKAICVDEFGYTSWTQPIQL